MPFSPFFQRKAINCKNTKTQRHKYKHRGTEFHFLVHGSQSSFSFSRMRRSHKLRASPVGFPTDNYETLCLCLYICVSVFDMNLYFARAGIVHIATLLLARPTLSSFVHAATSKRLNCA